jgi:hypothetical protein
VIAIRRNVWLTATVILVLTVLFPPWLYFDGNTSNQASAGYHFFRSPPPVKSYEEMFGFAGDDMPLRAVSVRLNIIRLITQVLTLAFLVMGLDVKLHGDGSWLSGCLLTQAVCGILLLVLLMLSKF